MLNDSEINFFNDNGYVVVGNRSIKKFSNNLIKKISSIIEVIFKNEVPINLKELNFEKQISYLWENEKKINYLKKLYELLPYTTEVIETFNNNIFQSISKDLGIIYPQPTTLPTIRVDRPFDKKYSTGIHQDYWYSFQSDSSLTFWMPLVSITSEMGYLSIIPKSHKLGFVKFFDNGGYVFKPRINFEEKEFKDVNVKLGQCLVFSQFLIHKSGKNIGELPRVTLQIRSHDMTKQKINTSFNCISSPYVKNLQKEILNKDE